MNLRKIAEMHYPNKAGNTQDEIYRQRRIDSLEKLLKEQLILPVVGIELQEKHTPTFEEFLVRVKKYDLDKTETYIKDLKENYYKYQSEYRHWLKVNL